MTTAVVLLNLGGPDSLDAVEPFLRNLFEDPDVLPLGPLGFLRRPLAKVIARSRARTTRVYYDEIGGKSPLRELTERQRAALERSLGGRARVYVAMRYWHPFTDEAVETLRQDGADRIVALTLYPQYSFATTRSSLDELHRVLQKKGVTAAVDAVDRFFDDPAYLDVVAAHVREGLAGFGEDAASRVPVLFSAHGLPTKLIDEGDPYLGEIRATMKGVLERLPPVESLLAFQSKVGPMKWLEPRTDDVLADLARAGRRECLVVPISFVSDHIETIHEVGVRFRRIVEPLGMTDLRLVPALNDDPAFIEALASLVRPKL
jgi:ferrochelatase